MKKILLILFTVLTLVGLFGCQEDKNKENNPNVLFGKELKGTESIYKCNDFVDEVSVSDRYGESIYKGPGTKQDIIVVSDDSVDFAVTRYRITHEDIQKYENITPEEFFEKELEYYNYWKENSHHLSRFNGLLPENKNGEIIIGSMKDYTDFSIFSAWDLETNAEILNEEKTKVLFEKYKKYHLIRDYDCTKIR